MLPSARTLPTGKLAQNPIRTGERRCILYVGDDSGITLASDHATHLGTIGPAREIEDLRERAERAERDQVQRALTNYGWTKCCEFFRGSAYGR